MKKYSIFMAVAALMFAVSCNKDEVNTVEPTIETELITVDLNPMTKTSLSGKATVWTAGDAVSVTVGGKNIGTLTLVEGSTFSGEVEAGYNGEATLNYPAGVTTVPASQEAVANSFANGAALLEGTTTMEALRAGEGASLHNTTALLQFSVAQAGDVTFEVGSTKYTVTGCKTGETYYACVTPVENVAFVARIGGYLSKQASKNVTFTANKIANLNELPAPVASGWTIVGAHNSWDVKSGIKLYNDLSGAVAKNVSGGSEFKLVKDEKDWFSTMVPAGKKGSWCKLHKDRVNMKPASGYVDVWVSADGTACGVVDLDAAMPSTYQYYVVLQHNWDWKNRKLHSWIVNPESNLMGNWPGSSPTGTFNYDNNGYSFWEIPIKANGVKIGVIFSNNGADQTQNNYIDPLNTDKCYWLEYRSGKGNFSVEM